MCKKVIGINQELAEVAHEDSGLSSEEDASVDLGSDLERLWGTIQGLDEADNVTNKTSKSVVIGYHLVNRHTSLIYIYIDLIAHLFQCRLRGPEPSPSPKV